MLASDGVLRLSDEQTHPLVLVVGDSLADRAGAAAELSGFGIEPRHLRAFKTAAEREVGLIEAVVTPLLRKRNAEAQARADEVGREIAALAVRLHAALVKAQLSRDGHG